jgi:hypothetical protein
VITFHAWNGVAVAEVFQFVSWGKEMVDLKGMVAATSKRPCVMVAFLEEGRYWAESLLLKEVA